MFLFVAFLDFLSWVGPRDPFPDLPPLWNTHMGIGKRGIIEANKQCKRHLAPWVHSLVRITKPTCKRAQQMVRDP
jgi:hypothetical protein